MPQGIAYADDPHNFIIESMDGQNWTLYHNGVQVATDTGSWMNGQEANVDERLGDKIAEIKGADDYTLEFRFPTIECFFCDKDGNASDAPELFYTTKDDSNVYITMNDAQTIIGGFSRFEIEYINLDSELVDEFSTFIAPVDNRIIRFGKNLNLGRYLLRYAAYEKISYLGRNYLIKRISSNNLNSEIKKAPTPIPEFAISEFVYGDTYSYVANQLCFVEGTFKVPQSLIDKDASIVDKRLDASTEKQTFIFDYFPFDTNYDVVRDVDIEILVQQKWINIEVNDYFLLQDDEVMDLSTFTGYYINIPFVGGDTKEDAGLYFVYQDTFGKEYDLKTGDCGVYYIVAKFTNPNYKAHSFSESSILYIGGQYIITPKRIVKKIGKTTYTFEREEGFYDIDVQITEYQYTYFNKDYKLIGAYMFSFVELQHNTIYPTSTGKIIYNKDFKLIIDSDEIVFLWYEKSGETIETNFSGNCVVEYPAGTTSLDNSIISIKEREKYESGWMWFDTVMISLIGVMIALIVVVVIKYRTRRWWFV